MALIVAATVAVAVAMAVFVRVVAALVEAASIVHGRGHHGVVTMTVAVVVTLPVAMVVTTTVNMVVLKYTEITHEAAIKLYTSDNIRFNLKYC